MFFAIWCGLEALNIIIWYIWCLFDCSSREWDLYYLFPSWDWKENRVYMVVEGPTPGCVVIIVVGETLGFLRIYFLVICFFRTRWLGSLRVKVHRIFRFLLVYFVKKLGQLLVHSLLSLFCFSNLLFSSFFGSVLFFGWQLVFL